MNDQLEQALSDLIVSAVEAKDFLVGEMPDVIHQLLMWKMWFSLITEILGIVIVVTCFYITKRLSATTQWKDGDPGYAVLTVASGVVGAIFLVVTVADILCYATWLQILVAPKVYLLEYAAGLIK